MKFAAALLFASLLCVVVAHGHGRHGHNGYRRKHHKSSSEEESGDQMLAPGAHPEQCSYVTADAAMLFNLGTLTLKSDSYKAKDDKGNLWQFNVCAPLAVAGACDSTAAICKTDAKQVSHNAGLAEAVQWSELANYNGVEMVFGNGEECGEGKTMKTSVSFVCTSAQSPALEIVNVTATDACFTQIVVASASACAQANQIMDGSLEYDEDFHGGWVFPLVFFTTILACCCCCARRCRHKKLMKQKAAREEMMEFSNVAFHQMPTTYPNQTPVAMPAHANNGQQTFLAPPQWFSPYPMQQIPQPVQLNQTASDEQFARLLQDKFNSEAV